MTKNKLGKWQDDLQWETIWYLHFSESRDKKKKKFNGSKKSDCNLNLTIQPLPTVPHPEHFCSFPGAQLRSQAVDNFAVLHHRIQCTVRSHWSESGRGSTKHVTVDCWVLSNNLQNSSNTAEIPECSTATRQGERGTN